MTLGPEIIGAFAGLVVGLADFVFLGVAARGTRPNSGTGRAFGPLKLIRILSLFVFPIVGWFVGPLVAENLGV